MATATITPDQDLIMAEIHIAAPPERVFVAISDPSQVGQWWGQAGMISPQNGKATVVSGVNGALMELVPTARHST